MAALIQGGRLVFAALGLQVAGYLYSGSFQNIGFILLGFILVTLLSLLALTKEPQLMN